MERADAARKYREADRLFRENCFEEALALLDELNRAFPNDPRVMKARSLTIAALGGSQRAGEGSRPPARTGAIADPSASIQPKAQTQQSPKANAVRAFLRKVGHGRPLASALIAASVILLAVGLFVYSKGRSAPVAVTTPSNSNQARRLSAPRVAPAIAAASASKAPTVQDLPAETKEPIPKEQPMAARLQEAGLLYRAGKGKDSAVPLSGDLEEAIAVLKRHEADRDFFVKLTGKGVSDAVFGQLVPYLKSCSTLGFWETSVTPEGLRRLKELPSLRCLNLSWQHTPASAIPIVAELRQIEYLDLHGADVAGDALAPLERLSSLRGIDLSGSTADNAAMKHVAAIRPLRCLAMSFTTEDPTKVTDEGLTDLAKLPNLEQLDVSGCTDLTDAACARLSAIKTLTCLYIGGKITDEGIKSLAQLSNLEQLQLWYSEPITDEGLRHLKALKRLKKLGLRDTHITQSGLAEFQQAVPGCAVNINENSAYTLPGLDAQ